MLSTKKDKNKNLEPGTAQNRINEGTIVKGDISSEGFFRIDGYIEGNIQTPSKVVLGKSGMIIGSLRCENADIEGKVDGTIEASGILTLRATARIEGEITVGKLAVEPGAVVNASCLMIDEKKSSERGEKKTASAEIRYNEVQER
ncbi:MAG TPA: polymer-forming cytoskeletal protein [Flavobacteriaceae bacterium]|nr:polymer-forming cytoskeletal protein [Flavobacteriaceae bacterium]